MESYIDIKNARANNLKNISLKIPKNSLTVICGVSGSGKSTLAFDTIFAEGQRRYMESLSSYARQFLGSLKKPDVDDIKGLSPAISIDQKTTSSNPRSIVGTVTEIYDYLRLLYANIGFPYYNGQKIQKLTVDDIVDIVLKYPVGSKISIFSPVVINKKGSHKNTFDELRKEGFLKVRINKELVDLDEKIVLDKNKKWNIDVLISRILIKENQGQKISQDIELALSISDGKIIVLVDDIEKFYSTSFYIKEKDLSFDKLSPQLFSFNSPLGSCSHCFGIGSINSVDEDSLLDYNLSINEGSIKCLNTLASFYASIFESLSNHYNFSLDKPMKDLDKDIVDILLHGSGKEKISFSYESKKMLLKNKKTYNGLVDEVLRRYNGTESYFIKRYFSSFIRQSTCKYCKGDRLNELALMVEVDGFNIIELCKLSIKDSIKYFENLKLNDYETQVANQIIEEIKARLSFLDNVGLSYLSLFRKSSTLSGGEAQRIRLASQIGSGLSGVLYVLDEPSIGLHQKDNQRLIKSLQNLKNLGNTLIVVEHDKDIMLQSDYIIEIGLGAGDHGGNVTYKGKVEGLIGNKDTASGEYLNQKVNFANEKKTFSNEYIKIVKAEENNLKKINVSIPKSSLTCITGVSGSGKSTLINNILYPYVKNKLLKRNDYVGDVLKIEGIDQLDKVINVDQGPIGRSPNSNPATYIGVFDYIRELFASLPNSKAKGYKVGRFSFNVDGGRCNDCKGDGFKKIEMHFLSDVYVVCETCKGKRYNRETLQVYYKNNNISDILNMSALQAYEFFLEIPKIKRKLQTLIDVGLEYIKLGQSALSLSGGEAQRIKLAYELSKKPTGKTLYILDEPTTGLHFKDINKLLDILKRLVFFGNTVVVIEHNLDVILQADYIVDLGKGGGDMGGDLIYQGDIKGLVEEENSYTGLYLKEYINKTV